MPLKAITGPKYQIHKSPTCIGLLEEPLLVLPDLEDPAVPKVEGLRELRIVYPYVYGDIVVGCYRRLFVAEYLYDLK